ncbi:MAG: T9SS type A sorting domain-containing protein [Desulfobulbaceae bacterium]|nr:T9SS type A sorting domain-containing protein [Desulfobulbaceae bacterium]
MKLRLMLFLIIIFSNKLFSKDVWIYTDDGTWSDGIIALEQFFDYNNITHKRVYAFDLNNTDNYNNASAICFPGGYAYNYKVALTDKAVNNIRHYIANGGSYIGVCAGAFFASSNVVWEDEEYSYSLSLFKGKAIGSIPKIAKWDNYAMTNITINQENKILQNSQDNLAVLYYGGPYFESEETIFDTIATWDDFNDLPAIISFEYEQGKVLLIGPHLEIEENDDRDSVNFAQELNDVETDWDFLSIIVNWVLGFNTTVETNNGLSYSLSIYPNPASEYIEIAHNIKPTLMHGLDENQEIKIYNTMGECITTPFFPSTSTGNDNLRIDISYLSRGVYYIRVGSQSKMFVKK